MPAFSSLHVSQVIPLAFTNESLAIVIALILFVPIFLLLYRHRQKRRLARRLAELHSTWGQEHQRDRNFELLNEFHRICPPTESLGDAEYIDDHTWNDLSMGDIYTKVDRTITTAGECLLYRILRSPLASNDALAKRSRLIRLFQEDAGIRQALQLALLSAGRQRPRDLIALIWNDPPKPFAFAWFFYVLTGLAIVSLSGALFWGSPPWILAALVMFMGNMFVHYRVRNRLMGRLGALRQLRMLINASRTIAAIPHPDFADYASSLLRAAQLAQRIADKVSFLQPESSATGDIFAMAIEYISIFFLHEVRTFHVVLTEIIAHGDALKTLFLLTGELDAWLSVAGFRAGLRQYVEPQFGEEFPRLDIRDARHPLLADPTPNSIEIRGQGIAITGSNMSGKTTFLKTIATNVILAQSIFTCLASSYRGRKLRIISSMNEVDNLLEGKSYYLAEAERLLEIVRQAEGPSLVLVLIDEPLAGTNSPERLAASREILRYLSQHNGLVMVSTHDVELVAQLEKQGQFEVFHFADLADDRGIRFDYQLRRGLDYHGNAIKVLKYLGYPDAIIEGAMREFPASVVSAETPDNQGTRIDHLGDRPPIS